MAVAIATRLFASLAKASEHHRPTTTHHGRHAPIIIPFLGLSEIY